MVGYRSSAFAATRRIDDCEERIDDRGFAGRRTHPAGGLLRFRLAARNHDQLRAAAGQLHRGGQADAAGRAGDKDALARDTVPRLHSRSSYDAY